MDEKDRHGSSRLDELGNGRALDDGRAIDDRRVDDETTQGMSNLIDSDVITRRATDASDVDESCPDVLDPEVLDGLGANSAREMTIETRL